MRPAAQASLWIAAGVALLAIVLAALYLLVLAPKTSHIAVPNVAGETQSAAIVSLQREGLVPVVTLAANARVASGLVVGTTPQAAPPSRRARG